MSRTKQKCSRRRQFRRDPRAPRTAFCPQRCNAWPHGARTCALQPVDDDGHTWSPTIAESVGVRVRGQWLRRKSREGRVRRVVRAGMCGRCGAERFHGQCGAERVSQKGFVGVCMLSLSLLHDLGATPCIIVPPHRRIRCCSRNTIRGAGARGALMDAVVPYFLAVHGVSPRGEAIRGDLKANKFVDGDVCWELRGFHSL